MIYYCKIYYEEIKNRMMLIFLFWAVMFLTTYAYKDILTFTIIKLQNNEIKYFIYVNINELFLLYIDLSKFLTNEITKIYILFHLFSFLSTGLYKQEILKINFFFKLISQSVPFSFVLTHQILFPFTFNFFINLKDNENMHSIPFLLELKVFNFIQYFIFIYATTLKLLQFLVIVLWFLVKQSKFNITYLRLYCYSIFSIIIFFTSFQKMKLLITFFIIENIFILFFFFYIKVLIRQPIKT